VGSWKGNDDTASTLAPMEFSMHNDSGALGFHLHSTISPNAAASAKRCGLNSAAASSRLSSHSRSGKSLCCLQHKHTSTIAATHISTSAGTGQSRRAVRGHDRVGDAAAEHEGRKRRPPSTANHDARELHRASVYNSGRATNAHASHATAARSSNGCGPGPISAPLLPRRWRAA
jgi:hypothetical protein